MTVTKRKQKPTAGQEDAAAAPLLESGTKATCDSCSTDITHNVHIRCAESTSTGVPTCPDFDLCVTCFLSGKQAGPHRATHAYRVISSHAFPIFDPEWGADEELLLIEGAEMYGLGNWADAAEHVGGRTKEECEQHYRQIYLKSPEYPLPVIGTDFGSQEDFVERKKRRLEDLQSRPLVLPPPKPLASAPTCHDIGGYMPGRLEFETEYENEAETLIKDLEFGKVYRFGGELQPAPDPPPVPEGEEEVKPDGGDDADPGEESEGELELKLTLLEMFNERYDRRVAAKDLIFDRGLINYRQLNQMEKKRSKEDKDVIQRAKVYARIQTAEDHERFVDGLLYETMLKKRIAELQEYRRNGVTTLAEGERYDHARTQRLSQKAANFRDSILPSYDRAASRVARLPNASSLSTPTTKPQRTTSILTLASSSSLNLLTPLEQQLCSTLRLLPRPYLFLKETLLREWTRLGGKMGASDARALVGVREGGEATDWAEKVDRVWEFLVGTGGLRAKEQRREEREKERERDEAMNVSGEEGEEGPLGGDGMDVDAPASGQAELGVEMAVKVGSGGSAPVTETMQPPVEAMVAS